MIDPATKQYIATGIVSITIGIVGGFFTLYILVYIWTRRKRNGKK